MNDSMESKPAEPQTPSSYRTGQAPEMREQENPGIIREFLEFLREEKKWWIAPLLIALALLAIVAALAGTAAAPFIYTLY